MQCPFCRLDVPADAQKCGHCGEWLVVKAPDVSKDRWDKMDISTRAVAAIALPLLLLIGGYFSNKALSAIGNRAKTADVNARLIEVAVGVLQSNPQPGDAALRAWAIRLINARLDDVKLGPAVQERLRTRALPSIVSPYQMNDNPGGPFGPTATPPTPSQGLNQPVLLVANKAAAAKPKPIVQWTGAVTAPNGVRRECKVIYVDLQPHAPLIKPIVAFVDRNEEQMIYVNYEPGGGKMLHVQKANTIDATEGTVTLSQRIEAPSGDATFELVFDRKDGWGAPHGKYEFHGTVKLPR